MGQGQPALKANLKASVLETGPEPGYGSLGRTEAEDPGNTPSNGKILLRVSENINQLTRNHRRNPAQGGDRLSTYFVPGP